ncbi:Spore wall protein 9 [Nosema granulosis]|uniref:Spore wall protein 9 n=1 Tax=Nosema granulosis TaxID=83296 RepID=A0A9P6KZ92_9MICR|nr:Spore wall protein 9 [Nosema granulosis]
MTTKPNKTSSFTFRLFKWSAFILVAAFILYPALQVLTVFFGKINPKLRARVFMSYRVKYADPMMLNGRYKSIKENAYPTDPLRVKFNKIAQDKKTGVLTKYPYPEHFPREPEWNFTLCDEAYYLHWNVRVNVCKFLENNPQDNPLNLVKLKDGAKVDKYFRQYPKMTDQEYKELFTGVDNKDGKGWGNAATSFIDLLLNIIEKPNEYTVEEDKVSEKLENELIEFIEKLGYEDFKSDDKKKQIKEFFIKYGEAYPTVFHSAIYSRCFYFFMFLTINGEFDFSEIEKKADGKLSEMKIEEYNKRAMSIMANVFAQIFAKVYQESWKYELTDANFREKITQWFGPKQKVDDIADQSENIEKVKELLKKNKALLAAAGGN